MNEYHVLSKGNSGHGEDHDDAPAACGEVPAQDGQSGWVRKVNTMFSHGKHSHFCPLFDWNC